MNKALLTAASIVALCAGGASAAGAPVGSFSGKFVPFRIPKGAKILWDQNSNNGGTSVNSQNFTSGDSSGYNDQGADDFVIPKGRTWQITKIDVTGEFFNGFGPATSENVIFYKNKNGVPGEPVKNGTFDNLVGAGSPNFAISLPGRGLQLRAGQYWVSVIANVDFPTSGQWGWEVNDVRHGFQAMWQNPPGGFRVCPTWGTIETCNDSPGPDLMFEIKGTTK